ncbi:MAG: Fumarate hydratase class II [Anaerolineae bacterium]|nr:Fumarate hydratase class II [Anaerolineae bacterium]
MSQRIEKDSMGELQVPADALWGAQTQRALHNFPISHLKQQRAFIWSMALIKRAAAEVNRDLGLLDANLANAIAQAAQEVMDDKLARHFELNPFQAGAGTSHNMNVNEVIANRANQMLGFDIGDKNKPVNPNDHVNMAQSTNDTIPTAIRLGILFMLDALLAAVDGLADALQQKAVEFDDIVKSGRTHLQDAVPVRMGQEFGGYAQAIRNDRERIATAADRVRRLGIGGTAAGTGLNAHPEYHARMIKRLNELTHFNTRSSGNLFESMQSNADAADFSAALNTLALTLTRIANDFRLLASGPTTGLDEIRLPAVQPGSSIMPGKVNPVLAEMLNMVCYHVMGNNLTVQLAAAAGQLELNVMMPVIAYDLFEAMEILTNALAAFTTKCVVGIQANREKAEGWLGKNVIIVTALNPVIGYNAGAALAKEATARNLSLREVAVEKIAAGTLKHRDQDRPVSIQEVDAVLNDLRSLTEGGVHGGGGGG